MEKEKNSYIIYVKTDGAGRIRFVDSSAFLTDTDGFIEIDRGSEYRYKHAQGNYFPEPIYDDRGVCRYKLEDGKAVERTQEEMDADYVPPVVEPTDKERIAALEEQNAMLIENNDMLTECVLEMSSILYA